MAEAAEAAVVATPAVAPVPVRAGDSVGIKALGFSLHKRRYLAGFLAGHRLTFIDDPEHAQPGDTVAVWASSPLAEAVAARAGVRVLRLEDGFLRSVGLGAQLTQPLSWVVDETGIYFDATRPSDLERMLQAGVDDPALLERARRLRERIVAAGISKYNVGATHWSGLSDRRDRRRPVVLVAGQVERDASIRAGAIGGIATNHDLIRAARAEHPDGWLVYKPHPDVVAGLRRAGAGEDDAATLCDEIVVDAPMPRLLAAADVVHVITSLTGFEALLRNRHVYCHGLPFYAGWGLTEDGVSTPRRSRRLQLDELVAAALLRYPRYVSRANGEPCSAEQALQELIAWRQTDTGALRWWHRLLRPMLRHD
ncbi:MAG: beta-3-deoxy-D-manno-oct-2-ulosonic acid transferase [Lautropia sp.]